MTTYEELVEAVRPLAEQIAGLYDEAARRYEPEVDAIVGSGSRDEKRIEHTLDGLLDFGDDERILRLYKRLCRYYWTIDKTATAEYVMLYRDHWDSAASAEAEATS